MKRRAVLASVSSVPLLAGCLVEEKTAILGRGSIDVVVDGEPIDLSANRFQSEYAENDSIAFHLHEGHDEWFMEGEDPVTFAEGIDLLPHFEYTDADGDHVVTIDGETYDAGDPETELTFTVDGEAVDPTEYEVRDGDALRLEITTGG
ncbi:hypothetical protein ACFO5R_15030 [Halosolutus amylolyticus]|uniref:DUF4382 domain-containing protein n=1 Tax=Halosolutus amylolyticus TaxID=2932267 RepID=A0ABD5PRL3_9EURY|nr:hypothetical protein [Halosolutus amylolyticus]